MICFTYYDQCTAFFGTNQLCYQINRKKTDRITKKLFFYSQNNHQIFLAYDASCKITELVKIHYVVFCLTKLPPLFKISFCNFDENYLLCSVNQTNWLLGLRSDWS